MARCDLGDPGGVDDLRAALALCLDIGAGYDTAVVYNNLAEPVWLAEGPAAALVTCQEAIDFAERRGWPRASCGYGPRRSACCSTSAAGTSCWPRPTR